MSIWGLRLNDMMNSAEIKKGLRREYISKRDDIPVSVKKERDFNIAQQLLESDLYNQAQEILCYVSTEKEIDTRAIVDSALQDGKSVYVPRCTEQRGVMRFYRISSYDELKSGKYGILEPDANDGAQWRQCDRNALCVVPALCCDRFGNRLGYGAGYYDRFLADFKGGTVCLCYSEFSDVDLPLDEYDIPCKVVIKG